MADNYGGLDPQEANHLLPDLYQYMGREEGFSEDDEEDYNFDSDDGDDDDEDDDDDVEDEESYSKCNLNQVGVSS